VKKGTVTEGSGLTLELVQLMMKSQHHAPPHRYKNRHNVIKKTAYIVPNTQEGTLPKYIGYTLPLQ